ncbi:hypothetical protein FisN_7Hh277 [Fistulifera solaris]|jgi:ABC-type cobalt transport system substrate-binding protein|uniref:Uncharacterized protein n=1 Tax=Fistulifera solaris TaxID=1519565 RepID=A0A1Z5KSP9_FISSO|nr:hypothetical protein FisN_7Hh277 [Fistulifera solaris]|eukprot:GAX29125.1 hypothetical protein FisN_7Hh277 [Fistulifera solaris]
MRLGILVCWLLWILCYNCSYAKTVSLGPVQLFRRKHGFKWEASIDRKAGIASSMEVSSRCLRDKKEFPVKQIFHSYPTWLCRFPVSLGLLRSVRTDSGICIQDRIFGRDLLIFGPAKSRLVSIALHEGTVQNTYSMELPIMGGLFAIPAPRAALLFTLSTIHGKDSRNSEIVTRISGYRPALIGQPPVSGVRSALYFSTQSLVHAGVMWRFHGYCWSKRRAYSQIDSK